MNKSKKSMKNREEETALINAHELARDGDFPGAIAVLKNLYIIDPSNHTYAFEYGHMLGQSSSGLSSLLKREWHSECIKVFESLCSNINMLTLDQQWKYRRHYFLYSGQHLQNRNLGYSEILRGNQLGYLSVGFGCLHHALDLLSGNEEDKEALEFASEAKAAFEALLILEQDKPGRHLAYALVLALLGAREEAFGFTKTAAALLGIAPKDMKDHYKEIDRLLAISIRLLVKS
jgi:hypothetical protein